MEHQEQDMWERADQEAQSAPLWTNERWHRANAIIGAKVTRQSDHIDWSEAA